MPLKREMKNLLYQDLQAGKNRLLRVPSTRNCQIKKSHNYSFNSNIVNNVNRYFKTSINNLFKKYKSSKKIKFTYNNVFKTSNHSVANLSTQTSPRQEESN